MKESPSTTTSDLLPRDADAIVLSNLQIPRLESTKMDLQRCEASSQNSTPKTLTPNAATDIFFKTRLCNNFTNKGSCMYGNGCTFAHGMEELRNSWDSRTRVCKMYLRSGICTYGANCSYAHVDKAAEPSCVGVADKKGPVCFKTNPCFSWRTSGRCSYGAFCRFIHGDEDSKKTGTGMEAEGDHKAEGPDDSSRSRNIFFKPIVVPSRLKKGSDKLNEMRKVDGIYGDWLE